MTLNLRFVANVHTLSVPSKYFPAKNHAEKSAKSLFAVKYQKAITPHSGDFALLEPPELAALMTITKTAKSYHEES